jgi:hypothetical protein
MSGVVIKDDSKRMFYDSGQIQLFGGMIKTCTDLRYG